MQLTVSCRLVCTVRICLKYGPCNSSTAENTLSYLFLKTNMKLRVWQMLVWQTAISAAYLRYCQWRGKAVNVILVLDPLVFLCVFWGIVVAIGTFTWKIHSTLGCSKWMDQVLYVMPSVCTLKLLVSKTQTANWMLTEKCVLQWLKFDLTQSSR